MGNTRFCSSCGEKLPENVEFCVNCGTPVSGAEKSQAPPPEQSAPPPQVYTPPMPGQPLQTGGQLPPARKGMSRGVMALIIVASIVGVLVIVGAIVGIALTVGNSARDKASERTCQANLRTIDGAVQMYYAENEKYPTSVDQLVPDYLRKVPKCPSGDEPYQLKGDPPSAYCTNVSSHNLDY